MNKRTNYPAGKYRLYVSARFNSAAHQRFIDVPGYLGLSEEGWSELSDDEKKKFLDEVSEDLMRNEIQYGWDLAEDKVVQQ